jgi:hypothetical protein
MDPRRPLGLDKSKPQAFIGTHTALRLSEQKAYLNFQGLGEKEFACSVVKDEILQCVGQLALFVFDQKTGKFNLAQLGGHVGDSTESLVVRFGVCQPPVNRN